MPSPGKSLKVRGGDLLMVRGSPVWVTQREAVAQAVRCRLRTFRGEWFLDRGIGLPYYQSILGQKSPRLDIIREVIRQEILATPGVTGVTRLTVAVGADRQLTGSFVATTNEGEVIGSIGDHADDIDAGDRYEPPVALGGQAHGGASPSATNTGIVTHVTISGPSTVGVMQQAEYSAQAVGGANTTVSWELDGAGTLEAMTANTAIYYAPVNQTIVVVRARSNQDPSLFAEINVTVTVE